MNRSHATNIFNIPSSHHFFESLFEWLSQNFSTQISDVTIFLPNQRSCREMREIFLQKNPQNSALILPKIKTISDISFEDFFDFLPQEAQEKIGGEIEREEIKQIIDELLQIKVISGIDHLFFLSQKIQKLPLFGDNLEPNQALSIATHLKDLFDEIEREEINLQKLEEVDDSDLSAHRQVTLEFLKNFHVQIKNALIKENIFFDTSYQNFAVQKFIQALREFGAKSPLIIAGSTGSVSFGKKLIQAIAQQENGYVILHGIDETAQNFDSENHPQFFLSELVKFLEIDKKQIVKIADEKFRLSSDARSDLLSLTMLPFEETQKWQNNFSINKDEIEKNFKIIAAKNELEEARIIALILAENFYAAKKSAVITNNQKLAKLLKYELESRNLPFNDSRNVGIFNSKLVNFILLILDLIESDFASPVLMAVLQNMLCLTSQETKLLQIFESEILRQDRNTTGLVGITEKLHSVNKSELQNFFTNFCQNLAPLATHKSRANIGAYTVSIIEVVENLSGKKWLELLAQESAQTELFEFFDKLKKNHDFLINPKNALTSFQILFSQISYFEKSDATSRIQILSTMEARLLNHDLVIVASLNEGDFPLIEAENWLGKKIRKDLEIDRKLKKVGQNAYDFCNYLCNPSVILTRSLNSGDAPSTPSPFLLKLETLCQKLEINFDKGEKSGEKSREKSGEKSGEKYFEILKNLNVVESSKIRRPEPKPVKEFRPKKFAITEISKLISDPYSIYAKKILQLRELQKIDFEPGYAEFGSFVHKALEEFVKDPRDLETSLKYSAKIFKKYFLSQEAQLIWWPKFENIFTNFYEQEEILQWARSQTEIEVKLVLNEILINGKIDRIAFDFEELANIFDYKTGQISSAKDVFSGIEPQLTIAALMLLEGGFKEKINSLNYWKLSSSSENEIKKICGDSEEIKILAAAAKAGLARLFAYFSDEKNGYVALSDERRNEYKNLARSQEWE